MKIHATTKQELLKKLDELYKSNSSYSKHSDVITKLLAKTPSSPYKREDYELELPITLGNTTISIACNNHGYTVTIRKLTSIVRVTYEAKSESSLDSSSDNQPLTQETYEQMDKKQQEFVDDFNAYIKPAPSSLTTVKKGRDDSDGFTPQVNYTGFKLDFGTITPENSDEKLEEIKKMLLSGKTSQKTTKTTKSPKITTASKQHKYHGTTPSKASFFKGSHNIVTTTSSIITGDIATEGDSIMTVIGPNTSIETGDIVSGGSSMITCVTSDPQALKLLNLLMGEEVSDKKSEEQEPTAHQPKF